MPEEVLAFASCQLLHGLPQLSQGSRDSFGTHCPGRGGMHARAAADEQRNAEVTLDGGDGLCDRGLRQMHLGRGRIDGAERDDFQKSL